MLLRVHSVLAFLQWFHEYKQGTSHEQPSAGKKHGICSFELTKKQK
jgi:hypothetical protein